MYSMQRTIPVPRQPTLPNVPWRVGQWNASRDGFFDLDERLASSSLFAASGLHLPLAPQSIFMPDYPVLNHSVVELVGYQERWVRERFLKLFRTGCGHRPQPHRPDAHGPSRGSGDFLFVDSGSNEGTWSLLAAAHAGADAHPQGGASSRPRSPWARLTDYLPTLYLLYILTYLLTARPSVYSFGRARGLLAGTASDRGKI